MGKLLAGLLFLLLLCGCSMPRIIQLNDPLDARQHNDLGVAYEMRGEYDLALREYRRAAEQAQDWALPLSNLGNVHARQGQWAEAIAAYRSALQVDPHAAATLNNLAWALVESGKPVEGISFAEQAVARESDNPNYWETLASAYLAVGRGEDARRAAHAGLALDPPPEIRQALQGKLQ